MHGNVEEWTSSIYKSYGNETESVSSNMDTFYVSRGGSHGTALYFLRSSVRIGAPAFANNMALGFRVVRTKNQQPPISKENYLEKSERKKVKSKTSPAGRVGALKQGPYFRYIQYVNIPKNQTKFPYGGHNHDPAIANCPDGSLLAIFFPPGMRKTANRGLLALGCTILLKVRGQLQLLFITSQPDLIQRQHFYR